MAELPEKIGKYEILGVAGRGAMGNVYLGHDPFIDRKVAIKVCALEDDEGGGSSRIAKKMFFNEAQAAGALDNPNILRIFDAGETKGEPYIVMEYVEGADTLKPYCTPDNLLPLDRVVRLMHQCAKALDYAHRRGVLHRDIKPANIMLNKDGDAKIGDFGVAQRTQTERTQVMGMFGSPRYMSPEQARDDPLNNQSDLYSLGVVMYELVAGRPPFRAKSLPALVNMITNDEPPALEEVRPDCPEPLAQVVRRAMAKDTSARYTSGGELAADLAAVFEEITHAPEEPDEPSEEEKFAAARALAFFNDFSDAELEEVLEVSDWERYQDGERIITEGAVEQSFFVIVSGDVSISVGEKVIGSLGKGDCVGEMGYLAKVKRTASVVARGDISVMKVDSSLMEWASIPCQMRFHKVFQQTLIERLANTSMELAKHVG